MGRTIEQRSISLPPEVWPVLERLAAETHSIAIAGVNARQPSIAVMLKRLGLDELIISERVPWSLPAGLAEAAAAEEQRQRALGERQRLIDEQQKRVAEHTQQKASVQKTPPVKMTQLSILELEPA